jgi:hypothetical protein
MDASDLIKTRQKSCEERAVHKWLIKAACHKEQFLSSPQLSRCISDKLLLINIWIGERALSPERVRACLQIKALRSDYLGG